MPLPVPSRLLPEQPAARLWALWGLTLLLTLWWDNTLADWWVMERLAGPAGFAWQHNWWLEVVLHDHWRRAGVWLFVLLWVLAVWPKSPWRWPSRQRWAVMTLVTLCLVAVNLVKNGSTTSCPWDQSAWGGVARYVTHWQWGVNDGGPGRCFPGGHASSAFAFLPLVLPALWPVSAVPAAVAVRGRWIGGLILLLGAVAGAVQTVRGAHYPSHTAWTALICGGVALAGWAALRPWLVPRALPAQAQA